MLAYEDSSLKPPVFDYVAPDSEAAALEALAEHGYASKILAGGQSLIPLLNFRLAQPGILVDLNKLSELDYIRPTDDGGVAIGGLTRQRTVERSGLVAERAPLLAAAVPFVAHPQIRNRGTVGGSLAHADPSAELPVVAVASKARFTVRKKGAERTVEAPEFYLGLMATDLAPDEILVEMTLPPLPERTGVAFHEFARRHGDYALMGVAAVVTLDGSGGCKEANLVYLSAGEIPLAAPQACELLVAEGLSESSIASAAALASENEIEPTGDIHASEAYKRHLAAVLTRRALTEAWQGAATE